MVARLFSIAVATGFLVGLLMSAVQAYRVVPLIHHAELFETAGGGHAHDHGHDHGDAQGTAAEEVWAPDDGFERHFYTAITNVLTASGFALLLVGAYAMSGWRLDFRTGVIWGLCGFIAFSLAPAALLPPEVPGAAAAALGVRQVVWIAVAFSTATGIALFVFSRRREWQVIGVIIAAMPLAFTGPHGEGSGSVPPELAAQFVAASLVTGAVFWIALGAVSGFLYERWGARTLAGSRAKRALTPI